MKNNKRLSSIIIFSALIIMLCGFFAACDGDDCFKNSNYKNTEKALPGTVPQEDDDC